MKYLYAYYTVKGSNVFLEVLWKLISLYVTCLVVYEADKLYHYVATESSNNLTLVSTTALSQAR